AADGTGRAVLERLRLQAGVDPSVRILLVGWDGADWGLIDPLIDSGRMPHLARLRRESAWGRIRSGSPTLSPLLWTTAATGRRPEDHGIVDFLVRDPETGRHVPISGHFRRVKALWNIFTEFGLDSAWVAWWATWPAEPIRGAMVTDRLAFSLFPGLGVSLPAEGLVFPPGLQAEIDPLRRAATEIDYATVARFVDIPEVEFRRAISGGGGEGPAGRYRHPVSHLREILASTETYHGIALHLLRGGDAPSLLAVYYQGIDEVCHRFAHYLPPRLEGLAGEEEFRRYRETVPRFYAYQDRLLGELLDRVRPDTYILLLSDHGFAHGAQRPRDVPPYVEGRPGKWHTPNGVWLLRGPGVDPGRRKPATLYQITPTILRLVGLPLAEDMPGEPLEGTPAGGGGGTRIASYEATSPRADPDRPGEDEPVDGMEAEVLERLRSLGYIEGRKGAAAEPAAPEAGTTLYHSNLATLLMLRGDFEAAAREYRRALELQPDSVPALTGMSELAFRRGDSAGALEWARRAIEAGLDVDPEFYLWTADRFLKAGRAGEGLDFFRPLHRERAGIGEVAVGLGRLLVALGEPGEAESLFWQALGDEPACLACLDGLFDLLDRRGESARMEEPLRRALALGVRDVMPRNWLGLVYKRQGRIEEAEAAFRAGLEESPGHPGSLANLGSLYLETGRGEEAVRILEEGWRGGGRSEPLLVNLLLALGSTGRIEAAEARFLEAEAAGALRPSIYNAMAYGYYRNGAADRAEALACRSLEIEPDQPELRDLLRRITTPPAPAEGGAGT
ncbi:MAG: alkaline phosphatase family protein, partial [Acidobacteria bacterium]|nr:alkaline phosphatase family protein [Acidobacteriota bacterium]